MSSDTELFEAAKRVIERFRAQGATLATAESCTGGLICALLTEVPGASDVFDRGYVTYSNAAKSELVGVDPEIIRTNGAVSSQTAYAMAVGGLAASGASACIAVTGIAGPGGGSVEKPAGLVFVAIAAAHEEGAVVEEFRFGDIGRNKVRRETVKAALEMLLAYGLGEESTQ